MRILLSRTDSIGDVILTLPMAGIIKTSLPGVTIDFLGKSYTRPVILCSEHIESFLNWDEISLLSDAGAARFFSEKNYDIFIHVFPVKRITRISKASGIKKRIGTTGRWYNWLYCNELVRFSRRNSSLHEAQLNLKLLRPLNIPTDCSTSDLIKNYGFSNLPVPSTKIYQLIQNGKFNVILHPKSRGSAIEWGLNNFAELIHLLPSDRFHIFICGTNEDKDAIGNSLPMDLKNVTNLLGLLTLEEYITFISIADGIVAASTGPLHIAAALGKVAIGLYSSRRPIHPGRWSPLGIKAKALVYDESCPDCLSGKKCLCIKKISPVQVMDSLITFDSRIP